MGVMVCCTSLWLPAVATTSTGLISLHTHMPGAMCVDGLRLCVFCKCLAMKTRCATCLHVCDFVA